MARYCASCGTEVDDTAVFCPTCGQPIDDDLEPDIPAAPAWPDPAASDVPDDRGGPAEDDRHGPPRAHDVDRSRFDEPVDAGVEPPAEAPTRVEQRPASGPVPDAPRPHPQSAAPPAEEERRDGGTGRPSVDLPLNTPVTLSGWLIGIGSVLAVLGLLVILVGGVLNVIDLLLFLALLGVAATVFLAAQLPGVPHLRLVTLVIALIAFGVALDRIGFRGGGVGELLFFLGTAAAAIGAIILELGQDQPLGGSTS